VPRLTDRRPATNRHLAVDDDRLRGSHPLGVPIRHDSRALAPGVAVPRGARLRRAGSGGQTVPDAYLHRPSAHHGAGRARTSGLA
jgi:hypothetical protein